MMWVVPGLFCVNDQGIVDVFSPAPLYDGVDYCIVNLSMNVR